MKILVLAPQPFYIDRGTPIDVDLLVRALSNRGEDVDLVVYREGEDREYSGVSIHRACTPGWLRNIKPGFSWKKVLADIWHFSCAWRLIRLNRYDAVHAGEESVFLAMWFKRLYGVPYVYDMDSSIAQQLVEQMPWLKPLSRFFKWCETQAIRNAAAAGPVCNALADLARDCGARHVTTLHDISQLKTEDVRSDASLRIRLGLKDLVLLYVGNLEAYQGVELLLEAFRIVRERDVQIDLVIAGGTGDDIRRYRKKASLLRIDRHTHFIGRWPVANLGELLVQADILAAPRVKGINTPMKIFPYLHSGRPVVVTNLPTHTQILTDEIAELAPADPEGFAGAVIRLAGDGDRRARLGAAGRRFVEENHTFPAHQNRVDQLYQHLSGICELGQIALAPSDGLNRLAARSLRNADDTEKIR